MAGDTSTKTEVLEEIKKALYGLRELIQELNEEKINTIPYPDSWTAAQLIRHVVKSTNGIARTLAAPAPITQRNAAEKISELRQTFLDFSNKFQSPEFIVPENRHYEKQSLLCDLDESFVTLEKATQPIDLDELVTGLPMGETTKLELLHFVLFHTQRHLHQLHRINEALLSN